MTIEQSHTLPAKKKSAVNCSFYSPSECNRAWSGHRVGQTPCSLRGISAVRLAVIIALPGQIESVNLMLTVSLGGNLSNVALQHVMSLSCSRQLGMWELAARPAQLEGIRKKRVAAQTDAWRRQFIRMGWGFLNNPLLQVTGEENKSLGAAGGACWRSASDLNGRMEKLEGGCAGWRRLMGIVEMPGAVW